MDRRLRTLEEQLAHAVRAADEMSEVLRRQAERIDVMERRIAMLMAQGAERAAAEGGSQLLTDPPPPHW